MNCEPGTVILPLAQYEQYKAMAETLEKIRKGEEEIRIRCDAHGYSYYSENVKYTGKDSAITLLVEKNNELEKRLVSYKEEEQHHDDEKKKYWTLSRMTLKELRKYFRGKK